MASKWKKVKQALGLKLCFYNPPETLDEPFPSIAVSSRVSSIRRSFDRLLSMPTTPTPSSSGLKLSRASSSSSTKKTCAICLTSMKLGQGQAIFTAECSHTFHFHCIVSSVNHGNRICPICRANWKEVPFQGPSPDLSLTRSRINPITYPPHDETIQTLVRRIGPPQPETNRSSLSSEPRVFDDDEALPEIIESNSPIIEDDSLEMIKVETFAEISAVQKSSSHENFTVLIHLKAPRQDRISSMNETSRAPIDLVTVLDVSGSMAGTKLALLKQAMGFVIQNLGRSDRLSVIAFSSNARRLFPLSLMTENGKHQALQAVNALISNGGTNVAEGLKKGAKVLVDCKSKNPVCSIILLSDGQDTYTIHGSGGVPVPDYGPLLPSSIHRNGGTGLQIPVHAFGFGTDHDAGAMHAISELSGGTFSFIENESVIQDAFAQCIGGLLSIVVQHLTVEIACVNPTLHLTSIKAGSYQTQINDNARLGFINVGDLYAEEERDFLITVNIPEDHLNDEISLIKTKCVYKNPITKENLIMENPDELKIQRPEVISEPIVSKEVDRQLNRIRASEAMADARVAAENGDLGNVVSILENCIQVLSESLSSKLGDQLCVSLCAELEEMKERMGNRRVYEESGRAYVLSGLSSHLWQRATARGDSTHTMSRVHTYQTPSMVDMVTHSQTMSFANLPPPQLTVPRTRSLLARPQFRLR